MIGALLAAAAIALPPANAAFDYQIGEAYQPPDGVTVVSRDKDAPPLEGAYNICYVNAFQTQPSETKDWPKNLVLKKLGDDPNWGGEYLLDISTARKRARIAKRVGRWISACERRGFDAVEFDNLDSWTRFDDTPLEGKVPFGKRAAVAYARRLIRRAHAEGLAAAQKNTTQIRERIGFDFAIAEECGVYAECGDFTRLYGDHVISIEYTRKGFKAACKAIGDRVSVVLRDVDVTAPGSKTYRYDRC